MAATMPDSAAGKTTRTATCMRDAPRPKAPSRSDCGTADRASSATVAIGGKHEHPEHEAGAQRVEGAHVDADVAEERRDESEGEVAEHDRRDAREHLDDRLHDPANPRRRVLGQVDRRAEPGGDRQEHARSRSGRACCRSAGRHRRTAGRLRRGASTPCRRSSRSTPTSCRNSIESRIRATTIPVVVRTEMSAARASRPLITCSPTDRGVRCRLRPGRSRGGGGGGFHLIRPGRASRRRRDFASVACCSFIGTIFAASAISA